MIKQELIKLFGVVRIFRALRAVGVSNLAIFPNYFRLSYFGGYLPVRSTKSKMRIFLRSKSSDLHVLAQTFPSYFPKTHKRILDDIYSNILQQSLIPLIIDAGAYNGTTSVLFSGTFPKSKVVALEASINNYDALLKSVSKHAGIDPRNCAFGTEGLALAFSDPGLGEWGFRVEPAIEDTKYDLLTTVTIDELLKENENQQPFICKLDIEGSESLLTLNDWIKILKFPVVIIEPHDWMIPGKATIFNFMAAHHHCSARRDVVLVGENIWSIQSIDAKANLDV